MTLIQLKKLIKETIKEARIYTGFGEVPDSISTEYDLSPEEKLALKSMTLKQRQSFATKKLHQARKSKGLCITCGIKPSIKKSDGTSGVYCEDCLRKFRDARNRLSKKRQSCVRCPNPPLPGQKLCQKCIDELHARREKALKSGICIKCFKKPAETDNRGIPMQICKTCAKNKSDVEKLRRITNPQSEKERIKKRDLDYRAKQKALKIGYEIEEIVDQHNFCYGTYEDESFQSSKIISIIKKVSKEIDSYIEKDDTTDGDAWHIKYIKFRPQIFQRLLLIIRTGLKHGWYSLLWNDEFIYIIFSNGIAEISNSGNADSPKISSINTFTKLFQSNGLTNEYVLLWLNKALNKFDKEVVK